ncbi:ribose-5-phosphate isomerase A [Tenuibacillus multivorans]|uniref:Ribose-5-phosphate isomerase A n=1 Tax=Tenuibacillus multivorans TaxID=237069 RepID=A0A1H0FKB4_9BACI|nr:ribose-5-phosphate isomerase A [Tenuibacillus multivorans]SDN94931.1 ribose 5-phosphate isomerase A [Tenuibacillus multivorans]
MLSDVDLKKKAVGEKAVEDIQDGMTIGLGSGSTVYWMLKRLGEKVQEGIKVSGVPSSVRTENWAKEFGVPLTDFSEVNRLDLAIDGADEIDPNFNLIKGGGGSLLREKIVNQAADRFVVVADESKLVEELGAFPLPIEVVQFGWELTAKHLESLGCNPELRKKDGDVFVTNNQNYILDCQFNSITEPEKLHEEIKSLVGVVETGLFFNMTNQVLIGEEQGVKVLSRDNPIG